MELTLDFIAKFPDVKTFLNGHLDAAETFKTGSIDKLIYGLNSVSDAYLDALSTARLAIFRQTLKRARKLIKTIGLCIKDSTYALDSIVFLDNVMVSIKVKYISRSGIP